MFQLMTSVLFVLSAGMLLLSAPAAVTLKKGYKYFGTLLFVLFLAQFFMYEPGSDVSPYAFAHGKISAIRLAGLTLSAFVSIVLLAYIFFTVVLRRRKPQKGAITMMVLALIPNLIGLFGSASLMGSLDYFVKIMSPFMICFYLGANLDRTNVDWFKRLITTIQLMLVVQVLVCKITYGHFAAYNYYHEMAEEFFGFYNHPHSFTGVLAVLCIWNIYEVNRKERTLLNLILAGASLLLMYISGVRTYILTLVLGLLVVGICTLCGDASLKNLRKYVYLAIAAAALVGPKLLASFGASRVTDDVSSGRFDRWGADLSYALENNSSFEMLLGGGLEASNAANLEIFGVSINSLNLFVDMFMDYGIIGMLLMTVAYIYLFKLTWTRKNRGFQLGMLVTFFGTCVINSIVSYITIMSMMVLILYVMKIEGESGNESSCVKFAAISRGARK